MKPYPMMLKIFLPVVVLLMAFGCKRSQDPMPEILTNESLKIDQLRHQFHGKYRLISAVSSSAVDVNMDGTASSNLLLEIPILDYKQNYQFNIELRIYDKSVLSPNPSYILSQSWPEQYIWLGDKEWDGGQALSFNPSYSVSFVNQGTSRSFEFSKDLRKLTVHPDQDENPYRWAFPSSVEIDESGRLHVVNVRNFYTRDGVKKVTVTTVYERFTKAT